MVSVEADTVRRSLSRALRERLRDAAGRLPGPGAEDPAAAAAPTWSALVRAGAPGLDAPLDAGGLELGLTASTAVAEELGGAGLDARYLGVAAAIDAALEAGPVRHAALVERLVAGELPVTQAGFEGAVAGVRAGSGADDAVRLTGELAVDAGPETAVLAPVALAGGGTAVVLLAPGGAAVASRDPSGAPSRMTFEGGVVPGARLLCAWPAGADCPEGPAGRARVRQAAYLLGVARGALHTGVRHATERHQFGRPLRDFQSVAFRLAAAHVEVEVLRLAVGRAVHLADGGHPYGHRAAEVLAQAAETAAEVSRLTMQLCGARGLTGELPAHRYHLLVRREGGRLGRPGELWREAGRRRLSALARRDGAG
ncbi:hypothetical protein Asp14428_21530 [Actinoplanes sp. NBRC 14428]|nr:hypothetical protein Asp14428_21530 [Actinoplanes sp. NBRC 14428]